MTAVTLFVFYKLSTSSEMPGWVNYKPESRWGGININKLRYVDDITLMAETEEELKSYKINVKEESERTGLKLFFFKY